MRRPPPFRLPTGARVADLSWLWVGSVFGFYFVDFAPGAATGCVDRLYLDVICHADHQSLELMTGRRLAEIGVDTIVVGVHELTLYGDVVNDWSPTRTSGRVPTDCDRIVRTLGGLKIGRRSGELIATTSWCITFTQILPGA